MTVTLDLDPQLDRGLRALARAQGVSVERYVRGLISQEVRRRSGGAAIGLLERWDAEDATTDPEEIVRREREWRAFQEGMNRSHSSDRKLYP